MLFRSGIQASADALPVRKAAFRTVIDAVQPWSCPKPQIRRIKTQRSLRTGFETGSEMDGMPSSLSDSGASENSEIYPGYETPAVSAASANAGNNQACA